MKRPKLLSMTTLLLLIVGLLVRATPANAYEITTPVDPTGKTWEPSGLWTTTFTPNNVNYYTESRAGQAVFIRKLPAGQTSDGYYILNSVSLGNIPFEYGKYYSVNISFQMQNGKALDMQSIPALNRITYPPGSPYRLMSVSSDWAPCANYHKFTVNTGVQNDDFSNYDGMCNWGAIVYNIIVQATDTKTASFQLGMTNTDMFRWYMTASSASVTNNNQGTIFASTIMEFSKVDFGSSINQEQQQAGQTAQNDGQQGAGQAQTDADTGTATMFQTIGNILGAITDTPAGDCTINGNMGNVDLGGLNLCQAEIGPIRPIIQAVLYLVMALATYKIMIWIIGAIAGLINWVQTGNEGKETDG